MNPKSIAVLVSIEPPEVRCILREIELPIILVLFSGGADPDHHTWPIVAKAKIGIDIDMCLMALLRTSSIFGSKAPVQYIGIDDVAVPSTVPLVDEPEARQLINECKIEHQPLLLAYLESLQKFAPGWESRFPIGGLARMLKDGSFHKILAGEMTHRIPIAERELWNETPAAWWQHEPPKAPP